MSVKEMKENETRKFAVELYASAIDSVVDAGRFVLGQSFDASKDDAAKLAGIVDQMQANVNALRETVRQIEMLLPKYI